jgi:hypothetical protein
LANTRKKLLAPDKAKALDMMPVDAVVLDIEGTTTSIDFVTDTLYPYALERLPNFVRHHRDEPEVAAILNEARDFESRGLSQFEYENSGNNLLFTSARNQGLHDGRPTGGRNRRSVRLLVTTNKLEMLMAAAASIGFRSQPVNG